MNTVSKISKCPAKQHQSDNRQNLNYLLTCCRQHPENPISHGHSKQHIRLISQLKHRIRSGISAFVNISYINKLRNYNQSDCTKPHNNHKQIWYGNCFHQSIQTPVCSTTKFFPDNADDQQYRQKYRQSPKNQQLMNHRVILCNSDTLKHTVKL